MAFPYIRASTWKALRAALLGLFGSKVNALSLPTTITTMKRRIVEGLLLAACMLAGSATASSSRLPNPFLSPGLEVAKQPLLSSILDVDQSLTNCRPTGQIDDARCDYETVERDINKSNFFQLLGDLVQEKYFRFYKVDLYKDCPFWNENSLCMSRDCTVSKVDEVSTSRSMTAISLAEACILTVADSHCISRGMPVVTQDD